VSLKFIHHYYASIIQRSVSAHNVLSVRQETLFTQYLAKYMTDFHHFHITDAKFGKKFRTTSQLDRKYLQNETRYRQTENGIANSNLSCACALNSVNFGPQTAKNMTGVSTGPTRSRYVGQVS